MTTLIILGNTNRYTYANSIVAANNRALEIFQAPLTHIFTIHSSASATLLHHERDWIEHLVIHDIPPRLFVDSVVDIASTADSIQNFVSYMEIVVKGLDGANLMVDLSNGTSLQKNALSIASYILDIPHQYMIDIIKLSELTKERQFLPLSVLSPSYIAAPDSTLLDDIAYLNLSEMTRYKRVIESHTSRYVALDEQGADARFFRDNLAHSIQLKLSGDKRRDNAVYRIAASSISASVEELIALLIKKFVASQEPGEIDRKTFGQKLQVIESRVEKEAPIEFDAEFFRKFNDFMLYLRNSTTHKGRLLSDVEKFKADLAVKMSFPFIEFYTDIVHPILSASQSLQPPQQIKRLTKTTPLTGGPFYYGLDGDDTGGILEELFISSTTERNFRRVSQSITTAIKNIGKSIRDQAGKEAVVLEAGDDLLFKGHFAEDALEEMQRVYCEATNGLTCSIGYGRSFQEVYLALKLAKTQPGKGAIIGIELS